MRYQSFQNLKPVAVVDFLVTDSAHRGTYDSLGLASPRSTGNPHCHEKDSRRKEFANASGRKFVVLSHVGPVQGLGFRDFVSTSILRPRHLLPFPTSGKVEN